LKTEIFRETITVALEGLVQGARFHAVEPRQIRVQNNALTAQGPDERRDGLVWSCMRLRLGGHTTL
jgi:hypothetical protein